MCIKLCMKHILCVNNYEHGDRYLDALCNKFQAEVSALVNIMHKSALLIS